MTTPAIAYMRTSSASGVGANKDSEKRQRHAITTYATGAGFNIVAEFYDAAVSGIDALESRPGFTALLDRIEGNGVRTVIVEDASRFARDLLVQELGILSLSKREVRLLTAGGDDLTATNDPTRRMMRQIAGAFAEYEKNRLVLKLRAARERLGRLGGRQSHSKIRPDAVKLARKLRAKGLTLRAVADQLDAAGFKNEAGRPYAAESIRSMTTEKRQKPSRRAPASR
jgi:DNA invertase Pin-like site-specific DNA recombinase